jgi:large conductance mechanosensitive channel
VPRGSDVGYWADFKTFLSQGNFVTLAVAFIVALALNAVVQALVTDIITPLIGVFFKTNFATDMVTINGSSFAVGDLINKSISFVIDLLVVFFLIIEPMTKLAARAAAKKAASAPTTVACPECLSQVPVAAKRCAFCAQPLPPAPLAAVVPAASAGS